MLTAWIATATVFGTMTAAQAAGDTVDEIHYSYGNTGDSLVFDWHGPETVIYYGSDASYGSAATASPSAITPVDSTGPFEEVAITGLTPNMAYHYKIGVAGLDHVFGTVPTASFNWVDMGDTATTSCDPWMAQTHSLVAAQNPNVVTHGGDISYANECGAQAVHTYYTDQEVWSHGAAFQPVWGNHEYGPPNSTSVAGAVRDSMGNYKGRSFITNGQSVPNDVSSQINNPGCGWETGSTANTCQGEDWGWFVAGHVLYISYPEIWPNAQLDWGTRADPIMAAAQADPNIDFIVSYGHRPAYTSLIGAQSNDIRTAVNKLAVKYSPSSGNPYGKYVLNIAHHVHGEEVFAPINGLVNITNGGGGAGLVGYSSPPDPNSVYRLQHPGILSASYDANAHQLKVNLLCGPAFPGSTKETCVYGSVVYSTTFVRPTPSATPVLSSTINDGASSVQVGHNTTYNVNVSSPPGAPAVSGVVATATVPANATIISSGGGTITGTTVSWNIGTLNPGQTVSELLTLQPTSGTTMTIAEQTTTTDTACSNAASTCSATDTDTVAPASPAFKQWITNQSVETNLTGWAGRYGPNANVAVTRDSTIAHTGVASIKVAGLAGAYRLNSGFNDSPRWVTHTTANVVYTQSAWVNPTLTGQQIFLKLREWNGSTLVADRTLAVKTTTLGWQQVTQTLTAVGTNDQLAFVIYGNMSAGQSFNADDFSLTSPS